MYNPYDEDLERFTDLCAIEGIDVVMIRQNSNYMVLDLEGNIDSYLDVEWCVEDSGGYKINYRQHEAGYATLTIGF